MSSVKMMNSACILGIIIYHNHSHFVFKVMKAEYRKKSPDRQVVNTLMDLTLADRRKLLKEDASLEVILDTYPFLQKDWQVIKL